MSLRNVEEEEDDDDEACLHPYPNQRMVRRVLCREECDMEVSLCFVRARGGASLEEFASPARLLRCSVSSTRSN